MFRLSFAFFLVSILPVSYVTATGGGGGGSSEEISMMVLDELFEKAAKQWGVTSETLWKEYDKGALAVEQPGAGHSGYSLTSEVHGSLELTLQASQPHPSASGAQAPSLMDSNSRTPIEWEK